MNALLLAGGLGTRLRPLTDALPKCLAPIGSRPLLSYWLELLEHGKIAKAVINTHHHAAVIERYIASGNWSTEIQLSHEPELLGTGGTVMKHASLFEDGPVLVAHADNLTRFDIQAFIQRHCSRPSSACMTMMTFATDQPQSCGIVELDDQDVVRAFHEKVANPPGILANAAVYVLDPTVIDLMKRLDKTFVDLSIDLIPRLLGRIVTYHNGQYHRDIGTLEAWRAAQSEFLPLLGESDTVDQGWQHLLDADGSRLRAVITHLL